MSQQTSKRPIFDWKQRTYNWKAACVAPLTPFIVVLHTDTGFKKVIVSGPSAEFHEAKKGKV